MWHGRGAITHCYIDSICMYICGLARWQLENKWRYVATHFFKSLLLITSVQTQCDWNTCIFPLDLYYKQYYDSNLDVCYMLNYVLLLLGIKYLQKALLSSTLNLCSLSKYETKIQSQTKMAKWFFVYLTDFSMSCNRIDHSFWCA